VITLTPTAVEHAKSFLAKRGKGVGIRISTKPNGCNGLAYVLEFADQEPEAFFEFNNDGLKVFVGPEDFVNLNGMKVDYVKKGLNEGFEFINPNESGRCGCGESFSV